jgi:hypothetical protein
MDDQHAAIVPTFVRELLRGDRLERVRKDLRLVGQVGLREDDTELWVPSDTEGSPESVASLTLATTIGGRNDPTCTGAERPWLRLLRHLLGHDPEGAARAARAWYGALLRASLEADDPVPFRAVSSYIAAVIGAYIGNDGMSDYWLTVGQVEAEADGDMWTALFFALRFVRAARNERPEPASAANPLGMPTAI